MYSEFHPNKPHMQISIIQEKVAGDRILCQNKVEDKRALYPKTKRYYEKEGYNTIPNKRKMISGEALTRE